MAETSQQLDTTIEIVTPENIAFHYRVAGPFRRWPAYLLDLAVRVGIILIVSVGASLVGAFGAGAPAFAAALIIAFLLEWFYGGFFESYWNGQTPGKWVMGIRVLTLEGQPINGMQAVMRNIFRAADMYPVLSLQVLGDLPPAYVFPTFFVGLIVMASNRRFQRVGDLVAGTMVVIEERHWLTGVVRIEDPRAAQLAEYLPADFQISRSLAKTLATYVERRRFFTSGRRREIARHLGEPLVRKLGLPSDTSDDLLLCALYHRAFIAGHGEDAAWESAVAPPAALAAPLAAGSSPASIAAGAATAVHGEAQG